jgi:pyruvate/2-oxoglutarate dehydrogenase complex dihydrolipoamide acyltransferase (E2) component
MSWKIGMPSLGHTMEEAKLVHWLKAKGDAIKAGERLAVVETDTAAFDVEAPADGLLLSIDVPADTVDTRCGKPKSEQSKFSGGTSAPCSIAAIQPSAPTISETAVAVPLNPKRL